MRSLRAYQIKWIVCGARLLMCTCIVFGYLFVDLISKIISLGRTLQAYVFAIIFEIIKNSN